MCRNPQTSYSAPLKSRGLSVPMNGTSAKGNKHGSSRLAFWGTKRVGYFRGGPHAHPVKEGAEEYTSGKIVAPSHRGLDRGGGAGRTS